MSFLFREDININISSTHVYNRKVIKTTHPRPGVENVTQAGHEGNRGSLSNINMSLLKNATDETKTIMNTKGICVL